MKLLARIIYGLYRAFSWLRYWMPRRFTRSGLTVLGALGAAAVLGLDFENAVAYQAFPLLLALLLLAVAFGLIFRARFSAKRVLPRFGTVGQTFRYRVLVKNLTTRTQSGLVLLENLADPRPTFREWLAVQRSTERQVRSFRFNQRRRPNPFRVAKTKETDVATLSPSQSAEVRVELTPLRRGVLRFIGMTIARPDPVGLFRGFVKMPLPQTVVILPRRYLLPSIALPGSMQYQQGGVALASNVGRSEEFVALREYRRGDPLRHIHWRSWAKTGKPIVKEFEDEFFVRHALVLDTFSDNPHSEVFEEAVSVAASFACTIETQESLLDLLFVGPQAYCFTAGRGLAHADQLLEILASVRVCGDRQFAALEQLVINHVGVVSSCICVLLAWDEARRKMIEKLRTLGVPVLVLVIVEPGKAQGIKSSPMRESPDWFRTLEVGRIEQELAKLR